MKLTRYFLVALFGSTTFSSFLATPAKASATCSVATRDKSNLSVYESPNETSPINELRFGRKVEIKDSATDSQGRAWVRIAGEYNGEYRQWGWVIRQYLECGSQSEQNGTAACRVATRDQSNLSVYESPNEETLINELRFGRKVDIKEAAKDSQGRTWVRIAGHYNGEYRQWGWVIRQYLACDSDSLAPPQNREADLTPRQKIAEKLIPLYAGEFLDCMDNKERSRPFCYELTFAWYKSDWGPDRRGYQDFKQMITATEGCVDKFRPIARKWSKAFTADNKIRMREIPGFKAAQNACEEYLVNTGWKERNRFNIRNRMILELAATALYREIINRNVQAPTDDPEGFAYYHFLGNNL